MCGPSKAMKELNRQVQNFAATTASEAQTIFGDASSIFNDLKTSLGNIVKGGPSQQGWSQAEINAVNSQIVDQAASSARNVKAATGNAVAAIGGGNAVTPSGLATAANLEANLSVEQEKSRQLNQAVVQNYETGRQNYFTAVGQEEQLPSVFNSSNDANRVAQGGYDQALKSQQQIDAASNWWQPLVMAGIGAGASFLTGGLSSLGSGTGKSFMSGATKNLASSFGGK